MTSRFTVIYYYVPEDHDDPSIPNAFGIPIPQKEITYNDIEKNFPLEGNYIFRFKFRHGKKIVWLDLQNKKDKVPSFDKMIFLKVTRINWGSMSQEPAGGDLREEEGDILLGGKAGVQQKEEDLFADYDLGGMGVSGGNNGDVAGNADVNLLGL